MIPWSKVRIGCLLFYLMATGSMGKDYCADFPINGNIEKEHIRFARECAGQENLGFRGRTVFHARFLNESEFNNLFRKARKTTFEIRIEDTTFTKIEMPVLSRAKRPAQPRARLFVIRDNPNLKSINIPYSTFDVTEPFQVVIDSNPELESDSMDRFQQNCFSKIEKDCDVYPADPNFCDALILASQADVIQTVRLCSGAKVIKQAPGHNARLDASQIGEEHFNELFKEAIIVHMCIIVNGTNIRNLRMPRLKRMFPCRKQSNSLDLINNPDLESVILGDSNDVEKFVINVRAENNPRLRDEHMTELRNICRNKKLGKCKISRYGATTTVETMPERVTTQAPGNAPSDKGQEAEEVTKGQENGTDWQENTSEEGKNEVVQISTSKRVAQSGTTKTGMNPPPDFEERTSEEDEDDYGGGWFGGHNIVFRSRKTKDHIHKKPPKKESLRSGYSFLFILISTYLLLW